DAEFPDAAAVAGRVVSIRRMGKASFVHIQDETGKIQVYLKRDDIGEEAYKAVFGKVDLGDYIGVSGEVFRTRTGEISVHGRSMELLSKSLRPLPGLKEKDGEAFDPFEDKENRYRQRYLDLIVHPDVKRVFVERARIISQVRAFLDKSGFLEVETPALQPLYGGASARPFTTHHNTLDQQLYLRIADELYLKRLIIGGFEKVYEIAKNFRNEGMDKNHNPEFTALEFYWAYADYHDTLTFTEELIRSLAEDLGRTTVEFQGHTIDLSKPFKRESLFDLLGKYSDMNLRRTRKSVSRPISITVNYWINCSERWWSHT
ncbi:amino acid--tRNA ligase-related protein, partial [Candidatus Neomarinimicrobiota bacterium]